MKLDILKLSLVISITGIFLLLILSNVLEPKVISINNLKDLSIGKEVKIQGEIFKIRNYEDSNFQVISIMDETGKIDVTVNRILNLTNNQTIVVTGIVQEYKTDLQINADKIRISQIFSYSLIFE